MSLKTLLLSSKGILLSTVGAVAVAAVAIGGTLAYLTSTDNDVNVMTLGNVQIEQIEQERDENGVLVDFTQDKPLYPAVGEIAWNDNKTTINGHDYNMFGDKLKNALDKIVTVKNTGESDAYVRTIIAVEDPFDVGLLGVNVGGVGTTQTPWFVATINGEQYSVTAFTYNAALKPGESSLPSLLQVYLKSQATNEDCEKFGDNFSILALSQAIQTEGFGDAVSALNEGFGEVNQANAEEWFSGMAVPVGYQVSNDAELAAAIQAGETEIWLNPGTYHAPAAAKGKTLTLNGTKDAVLEVVPAGQGEANGQLDYNFDGSKVTFNGITIKTNSQLYAGYARLSGTYNNCVIQNTYNLGTGDSAFTDCEFNITNEYLRVGSASTASFVGCTFNTDGRAILVYQDGTNVAQTVTVKDCTFNATTAANTWNGIHVAAVSVDGTNGTYVVNLEGTNTVDSDFNGLWQIKAGGANVTVNE
ncbi:MAG: hypothetical protein IJO59_06845 [Clostridia bacterium]|nr:hypothetical protein [Clostridia bacterium]